MENETNDIIDKFNNILKEKNIDISSIIGSTSSDTSKENSSKTDFDMATLLKFKNIFDKANNNNSPRNKLLYSLKPFLKEDKKDKLEKYIKIANILYVLNQLNEFKGDDS